MPSPTVFNQATGQWVHAAAIADPSGGTTVDTQSRAATGSILAVLRKAGVIAGSAGLNVSQTWNGPTHQIVQGAAIAAPSGGTTTDANLRTAIGSVLAVLKSCGLIVGGTTGPAFVLDGSEHQWAAGAAIADVSGGTTADAECRTAVNSALAAMRLAELIA